LATASGEELARDLAQAVSEPILCIAGLVCRRDHGRHGILLGICLSLKLVDGRRNGTTCDSFSQNAMRRAMRRRYWPRFRIAISSVNAQQNQYKGIVDTIVLLFLPLPSA
jgi:hypothetical protein